MGAVQVELVVYFLVNKSLLGRGLVGETRVYGTTEKPERENWNTTGRTTLTEMAISEESKCAVIGA